MYDSNDKFTMQPGSMINILTPQCIGCINNKPSEDVSCRVFGDKPEEYRRNKKRCPYYEKDMKLWDYFGDRADKVLGKPPEE